MLELYCSKCGPQAGSIASLGSLLEMQLVSESESALNKIPRQCIWLLQFRKHWTRTQRDNEMEKLKKSWRIICVLKCKHSSTQVFQRERIERNKGRHCGTAKKFS